MRTTCMVFLPFAVLTVSSLIGDELPRRRYTVNDLSSIADVQIPTCSTKGLYHGMLWEKHAGQPDDYVAEPRGQITWDGHSYPQRRGENGRSSLQHGTPATSPKTRWRHNWE